MHIRIMQPKDYPSVAAIYQQGIETQNATFETTAPDWETWHQRHLPHCRLLAVEDDIVVGFVALMPYSSRTVYKGVGVLSIYIHVDYQGGVCFRHNWIEISCGTPSPPVKKPTPPLSILQKLWLASRFQISFSIARPLAQLPPSHISSVAPQYPQLNGCSLTKYVSFSTNGSWLSPLTFRESNISANAISRSPECLW